MKISPNYCLVTQRIIAITADSDSDEDRLPDQKTVSGDVFFTPNVASGRAYHLRDEEGNSFTVPLGRVEASIVDGEIVHEGQPGISLFAAGQGSNPGKISYLVEYRNLRAGGTPISLSPMNFEAIPGGEVDLTTATPVTGATPAGTTKGDPGPAISIQGIITADSQLPASAGIGHAYVNTSTKSLSVWDGTRWFKVDNFAGVDADLQQISQWFAKTEEYYNSALSSAERAEFAAEETIQQVEGDFATRNYVDSAAEALGHQVSSRPTLHQTSAMAIAAGAVSGGSQGVSVGQATSIAYGAAAALSREVSVPPPVVVEGLPVWDASYPVYLWGDSAIDRGVSGDRLEDYLRSAVHQTVVDNSVGGTPIGDLLFRTGAAPLYGIPVGGVIPAGITPVEVDRLGADVSMTHGGEIPVTWAGVPGKITYYAGRYHESGYHVVEFTRSDAGEEVPIAAPTRLKPVDVFDPYATHIVVSGGNDWSKGYITTAPEGDKVGHLIGSYIKLVEQAAAAPVKHILIGGVKTRSDTMPGDDAHKFVTEVNNQLKQLFPHIFVDRQRWLCERGPEILGLELTPDEQIQRDAGIVPARVFSDSTHVGSEIRQAEAKELWAFALAQRGWAQLTTPVNGYHMPIMANTITTTDLV